MSEMVGRDNHLSKKMVPLFLLMDSIRTFFNRLRHVYEIFTNHCYLRQLQPRFLRKSKPKGVVIPFSLHAGMIVSSNATLSNFTCSIYYNSGLLIINSSCPYITASWELLFIASERSKAFSFTFALILSHPLMLCYL